MTEGAAGLPPLAGEHHTCPECGMSYADTALPAAVPALRAAAAQVRAAALAVRPEYRRVRPEPATWSIVEYTCHVRDVFATFTIRLHRTSTEDAPALEPLFADLRAERFRYNEHNLDAVLDELDAHIAGFLEEIAATTEWDRVASRRPEEVRTARWLVRHALHEARHHSQDIAAVGRVLGSTRP
jgi:DinB family protein